MVALCFLYAYILLVTTAFGLLFIKLTGSAKTTEKIFSVSFFVISITGFAVITALLTWLSLFAALGSLFLHLLIFLFSIAILVLPANRFFIVYLATRLKGICKKDNIVWIFFGLPFVIGVFYVGTKAPQLYDAELYYAQIIKWINNFPVIPGLGNLHGRLAYNSSFHIAAAFFDFSFLNIQSFYPLNSYFFILLFLKCSTDIKHAFAQKEFSKIIVPLGFLVYNFGNLQFEMTGPSTDSFLVILFYCIYILIRDYSGKKIMLLVLLSTFAITLKLSQAFLVLLPFVFFFGLKDRRRIAATFYMTGIFILAPWLLRNIILSGYLVYPLWQLDVFVVDWKIPATSVYDTTWQISSVSAEQNWIRTWAMIPNKHCLEILLLPLKDWFYVWYSSLYIVNKIVLKGCLLSVLVVPLLFYFKSKMSKYVFGLWFICIFQNVFWFFTAPDIRFAYGSLLLCFLFFVESFLLLLSTSIQKIIVIVFLVVSIYWSYGYAFYDGKNPLQTSVLRENFFLPKKMKEGAMKKITVNGIEIFIPEKDNRCYNSQLPCTPYYNPLLEMRGNRIESGFRIKK